MSRKYLHVVLKFSRLEKYLPIEETAQKKGCKHAPQDQRRCGQQREMIDLMRAIK